MKIQIKLLTLVFAILAHTPLCAQNPIYLSTNQSIYKIGLQVQYLENPQGNLVFNEVLSKTVQLQFEDAKQEVPNFGYSKSSFWIKFTVKDTSSIYQARLLQFAHPLVDSVSLYVIKKGKLIKTVHTGGILPYSSREIPDPTYLFELPIKPQETLTVYLNLRGKSSKQFPINLLVEKNFLEQSRQQNTLLGIYVGFFVAMIVYNFFLYLSLWRTSYLYYVLYMLGLLLLQLSLGGYLHEFFPEDWIHVANLANLFWVGFAVYFGNQFAKKFLRMEHYVPKMLLLLTLFDIVSVLLMLGTLLSIFVAALLNFLPLTASLTAAVVVFILLPSGIYTWQQGYRPARFYTLAWAALFLGIIIYVLRNVGIFPNTLLTSNAVLFGSVIEAMLLSMGLADRVNIAEKEKQEAQAQTIATLQEKENFISNQNKILEEKVEARTLEISNKNEILKIQNEEITAKNHEIGLQRDELAQKSEELTEALQEIKSKNQEIISSINYAQRIQNAMLPQPDELKQILSDAFVLFRPKDIVSGDFYWLVKKEYKIIIAVGDCTGHGVPGAFMSMIGNDLLNEIVGFRNICQPDHILNELHEGVRKVLRQEETQNNDGMDISICVIDTKKQIIEYAGAKSPMIYIQHGHLAFIRGDKLPIGGTQGPDGRNYTRRTLQMQSGDVFYLFSDGYQDQFGGAKNKKFMIKQLRELLYTLHELPMFQQKYLLEKALDDWKGKEKQIDDILLLGVRVD